MHSKNYTLYNFCNFTGYTKLNITYLFKYIIVINLIIHKFAFSTKFKIELIYWQIFVEKFFNLPLF